MIMGLTDKLLPQDIVLHYNHAFIFYIKTQSQLDEVEKERNELEVKYGNEISIRTKLEGKNIAKFA